MYDVHQVKNWQDSRKRKYGWVDLNFYCMCYSLVENLVRLPIQFGSWDYFTLFFNLKPQIVTAGSWFCITFLNSLLNRLQNRELTVMTKYKNVDSLIYALLWFGASIKPSHRSNELPYMTYRMICNLQ